jgi:hypothetical protein
MIKNDITQEEAETWIKDNIQTSLKNLIAAGMSFEDVRKNCEKLATNFFDIMTPSGVKVKNITIANGVVNHELEIDPKLCDPDVFEILSGRIHPSRFAPVITFTIPIKDDAK